MRICLSLLALILWTSVSTPSPTAEPQAEKSLGQAIREFNDKWESKRLECSVSRLTAQEVISAIRHESGSLPEDARRIAAQIADKGMLPDGTELSLALRSFGNGTSSYVWHVDLVLPSDKQIETDGRAIEKLAIRRHYLASQPQAAGQELKPLAELLK